MKIAKGRSALALSHRRPGKKQASKPLENWGSSISFVPPMICPCLYDKKRENKNTNIDVITPPNNLATQTPQMQLIQ